MILVSLDVVLINYGYEIFIHTSNKNVLNIIYRQIKCRNISEYQNVTLINTSESK